MVKQNKLKQRQIKIMSVLLLGQAGPNKGRRRQGSQNNNVLLTTPKFIIKSRNKCVNEVSKKIIYMESGIL